MVAFCCCWHDFWVVKVEESERQQFDGEKKLFNDRHKTVLYLDLCKDLYWNEVSNFRILAITKDSLQRAWTDIIIKLDFMTMWEINYLLWNDFHSILN